MKTPLSKHIIAITLALVLIAPGSFAQDGRGRCDGSGKGGKHGWNAGERHGKGSGDGICRNIPGLTEEQQAKIDKMKTAFRKDINPLQNQLKEKKAHLQTLSETDQPDQAAINRTIDEIAALQADIMKKRNAHLREVRALLTDEQKVWFDRQDRGQGKSGRGSGRACRGGGW